MASPFPHIDTDEYDESYFTNLLQSIENTESQTYTPNDPMPFPITTSSNEDFQGILVGDSVVEDSNPNNLEMNPPFNRDASGDGESTIDESAIQERYTTSPRKEYPTPEKEDHGTPPFKERYTTSPGIGRYTSNDDLLDPYMSQQGPYEAYESESQNFPGFHRDMQTPHEIDAFYPNHPLEPPAYLEPRINMDDDRRLSLARLFHQRNASYPPQRIARNFHSSYNFRVMSEADYRFRLANHGTREESDFPKDAGEQRKIVKRIFDAIRNVDEAEDSEKVKAMFRDDKVPGQAIEFAAWELMLRTRDSQETGQLVPVFQRTRYEQWENFTDRINEIIDILKHSKSVCKQLLQPSYIDRVADQPKAEHIRKACNQKLNKKKATQNKLGKIVLEAGLDAHIKEYAHQQKQASIDEGLSFAAISKNFKGLGASEDFAEPRAVSARLMGIKPIARSDSGQRLAGDGKDDLPVSKKRRRLEMEDEPELQQKTPSKSRSRKTSRR